MEMREKSMSLLKKTNILGLRSTRTTVGTRAAASGKAGTVRYTYRAPSTASAFEVFTESLYER